MKWQTGVAIIGMLIAVLIAQVGSPPQENGTTTIRTEAAADPVPMALTSTPNRWLLVFALLVMTSAVTLDVLRGESERAKPGARAGEIGTRGDA